MSKTVQLKDQSGNDLNPNVAKIGDLSFSGGNIDGSDTIRVRADASLTLEGNNGDVTIKANDAITFESENDEAAVFDCPVLLEKDLSMETVVGNKTINDAWALNAVSTMFDSSKSDAVPMVAKIMMLDPTQRVAWVQYGVSDTEAQCYSLYVSRISSNYKVSMSPSSGSDFMAYFLIPVRYDASGNAITAYKYIITY